MRASVRLTKPALADLVAINDYYLLEVSDKAAVKVIDTLETAINSLADLSELGTVPKELLTLGIQQYRQLIAKPYRIIYQKLPDQVIVHAILDGRRDVQTLLSQRLIGTF